MARFLLLLLALPLLLAGASATNISYDHRAIIIGGQRRILISGCIHYPRASPQMWPALIRNAKEGGLDMIDTYVFWDGHEPSPGIYNFQGRYDLIRFLKLVHQAGLYVNLRIGPYVCAEWNFGGFPAWLLKLPGIQFRTHNRAFEDKMEEFVRKIVDMVKSEQLFASQGGPVLFSQIENEYGNVQGSYGINGKTYMLWAARMAKDLETGVPWIMCKQPDAPDYIINTCNGYYCDGWKPNSRDKPAMWTENWSGWYQSWGEAAPYRTVEDVAFAVARFFQRGGVAQNYYMYFGGTNFGRTSGGPFITTSYDYDAPLDEFGTCMPTTLRGNAYFLFLTGMLRQPKWGHLKELHAALKLCETALTSNDPVYYTLGRMQEAHVYSDGSLEANFSNLATPCAAFLANIDTSSASVKFGGKVYNLPPWSVSILPDCRNVVFNTAQVSAQTSVTKMVAVQKPSLIEEVSGSYTPGLVEQLAWEWFQEPVGGSGINKILAHALLEQISTTNDSTDYMWYSTRFEILDQELKGGDPVLVITSMRDMVHIFVNGEFAGSTSTLKSGGLYARVQQPIHLKAGVNHLAILSATVGLQNYGAHLETHGAGITGSIWIQGLSTGTRNLTSALWLHQVGLNGEHDAITWSSTTSLPFFQPLVWYKANFNIPDGDDPVAIHLGSMGKGQAWVNGHSLGRFWPVITAPSTGCSDRCDYRGTYYSSKCLSSCGLPSQEWYHVPREWLVNEKNTLVLLEEIGGNVSGVSFASRVVDRVCAQVSEYSLPPVAQFSSLPELGLSCSPGQFISSIFFASFGNPKGRCGAFQKGSCHALESETIVEKACIGRQSCSFEIFWKNFGTDPCPGKAKTLAVEAACTEAVDSEPALVRT
ncbi:beta-galactosidase 8 isoform X1 [Selaginella moellendorffii]|uniref:beta-galactosidase 8 isoform X1 n=1 Tax=Selaginella moellendorffii TaxID=88036 RepID=UPI000D1C9C65|nr:beta-galactosidase 8 isoform X1 [Selaginella moellendorffii]|eukprot:XP_024542252.1 beta-galactosidase 8 isoform X1 [Selaginella moellendorffii]